jgi:hypothetical protein
MIGSKITSKMPFILLVKNVLKPTICLILLSL